MILLFILLLLPKKKKKNGKENNRKRNIPQCHRAYRICWTAYHLAIQVFVHFRYTSVGAKVWLEKASAPFEFPSAPLQRNIQSK